MLPVGSCMDPSMLTPTADIHRRHPPATSAGVSMNMCMPSDCVSVVEHTPMGSWSACSTDVDGGCCGSLHLLTPHDFSSTATACKGEGATGW